MGSSCCSCLRTIPAGQSYQVQNNNGSVRVVEGPKRLWACGRQFLMLEQKIAAQDEYLEIIMRDGQKEFLPGPAVMVLNPMQHTNITVRRMTKLRNQDLMVVYRPMSASASTAGAGAAGSASGGTKSAERHIVMGPKMYMPEGSAEWVHEFAWTDVSDEDAKKKDKTGAMKFTILQNAPQKIYHKVERVRTKDNALLTVKVMIFFAYVDLEKMLNNTMDPFADIINATSADAIEWCVSKEFDEFLASAAALNNMSEYRQLQAVATKIGIEIQKIVFRGYEAPDSLQNMHDKSIQERTRLELMMRSEEEQQKLAEFKLQKESMRASAEHEMEMKKLEHELGMKTKQLEMQNLEKESEIQRLRAIKQVDPNADIVKYLIAKEAGRPQIIQCGNMFAGEVDAKADAPGFWKR